MLSTKARNLATYAMAAIFLCLTMAGCVHVRTYQGPDSVTAPAFEPVHNLNAITGTYRNAGDPKGYLSEVLWGEYPKGSGRMLSSAMDYFIVNGRKVYHKDIATIEVRLLDKARIRVTARDHRGQDVKSQIYILGQDFKMEDGRKIPVHGKTMLMSGPDDPLLGPKGFAVELGLNKQGDIVCRTRSWGYGLVYSLIPVGGSQTTDWVFRRLSKTLAPRH